MVIDAAQFDTLNDEEFLKWLPIPGLRRAGDFITAVTIAPLTPLKIHNTGGKFQSGQLTDVFRRFGRAEDFQSQETALRNEEIVKWLSAK